MRSIESGTPKQDFELRLRALVDQFYRELTDIMNQGNLASSQAEKIMINQKFQKLIKEHTDILSKLGNEVAEKYGLDVESKSISSKDLE